MRRIRCRFGSRSRCRLSGGIITTGGIAGIGVWRSGTSEFRLASATDKVDDFEFVAGLEGGVRPGFFFEDEAVVFDGDSRGVYVQGGEEIEEGGVFGGGVGFAVDVEEHVFRIEAGAGT